MLLRPLKPEDAKFMYEWMTDPKVNQFFRFDKQDLSIEKCLEFIQHSFNHENHHYAIEENGQYMGTISLKHINRTNKTAEYAIALRTSSQGKGLGTKASFTLFDIAFRKLNLNKIYLDVLSSNTIAIHLYEKLGFKLEGELREHIVINNQFHNLKLYGLLRNEYEKN